jgi:hypothetical protein
MKTGHDNLNSALLTSHARPMICMAADRAVDRWGFRLLKRTSNMKYSDTGASRGNCFP